MNYMSTINEAAAVLNQIAEQDGVSLDIVRYEISVAIELALANAHDGSNPRSLEIWKSILRKDKIPTPEELIAYMDDIYRITFSSAGNMREEIH